MKVTGPLDEITQSCNAMNNSDPETPLDYETGAPLIAQPVIVVPEPCRYAMHSQGLWLKQDYDGKSASGCGREQSRFAACNGIYNERILHEFYKTVGILKLRDTWTIDREFVPN